MRAYVERWRFKHPKSRDFFNVVNEVAGEDLNWFFDQAFYSTAILDYSVDRVFTREIKKFVGDDFTLAVAEPDSGMTNGTNQSSDSITAKGQAKMYESGVDVRRLGAFKFPVEIVAAFEGGEKVREKWDGQELWKKIRYTKPNKLISATVDPENKIPLDLNYTNNSKAVKDSSLGVNKLSARWLFWMQFLLDQPEFMNVMSAPGSLF
jgi:hypothetical protein